MAQEKQTLEELREALKAKQKKEMQQMNARIADMRNREKAKERKTLTRKKIIIGALALNHMEKNPASEFTKKMNALINEYVIKDAERGLFDLIPLPANEHKK